MLIDKAVLVWSDVSVSSIAADNITTGDAAIDIENFFNSNITVNAWDDSNIALQLNGTNALFLDNSTGAIVGTVV